MYKQQRIHFIGIGGIGMSGIARVLLELGYEVSGSDMKDSYMTRMLASNGARISIGHDASNIEGADVVVVSSAVPPENPELKAAGEAGIPVIPRAEMLGELMRLKKFSVAVAGAHGKTSTTSMISAMMRGAGMDPTVIIGGKVNGLGSNACWGNGDFLVAEADESDGSFLQLCPTITVITNIDLEHLDFYPDLDSICGKFRLFATKVPFYGAVVACGDDPLVREVVSGLKKRVITYGTGDDVDLQARDINLDGLSMEYTAWWRGERLGSVRLQVPGIHHVQNSLAAVALGLELGLSFPDVAEGLAQYRGVQRRFEIKGESGGITVVDDYAHHPTEIRATLMTARACWPERRMVVLFEPHRYTRTKALMNEFPPAFSEADEVWITEIYPASEPPIPGVTGKALAETIREGIGGRVEYRPSCSVMGDEIIARLRPGDVVLTLGAGSIGSLSQAILDRLMERERVAAG